MPGIVAVPASMIDPERLAAFVLRNRDHLAEYLPAVAALHTVEAARDHFAIVTERVANRDLWEWHLVADGELCGAVRLNRVEHENKKVSVAYCLGIGFQGRGIATAAARAAVTFAFDVLGMNRIELRCVVTNAASVRVAERLGFTREGELREAEFLAGRYHNHYVFGLLRSEFAPHPAPESSS
jgi:ribosomal-protein-serine acetyltransferase